MSDQPQYRRPGADQPTQYSDQRRVEDPPWSRQDVEEVRLVKLDRPVYTGMMVGFGLMVAGIVFSILMFVVVGILGVVLGGALSSANF